MEHMRRQSGYFLLLAITLLSMQMSCQLFPEKPDPKQTAGKPGVSSPKVDTSPIVQFWDNGNYLNGKVPTVLFVAWEDGRVVRQLGGRLYEGQVSANVVKLMIERLSLSGALQPQLRMGMLRADGPSQLLWIRTNEQEISLRHDGTSTWDDLQRIAISAEPSRRQMESFVEMWGRAVAAIDDIWPPKLEQIQGVAGLRYPGIE